jgi:hypothetical protein
MDRVGKPDAELSILTSGFFNTIQSVQFEISLRIKEWAEVGEDVIEEFGDDEGVDGEGGSEESVFLFTQDVGFAGRNLPICALLRLLFKGLMNLIRPN